MTVYPLLPTFPEVRCDECSTIYTVETRDGVILRGSCPDCGHERFSTSVPAASVSVVVEWHTRPHDERS